MRPFPERLDAKRAAVGWTLFCGLLLAAILVPFFLFGERLEAATRAFLDARPPDGQVALVLGGLLAADLVLPVPSSLLGTAAGALLGFWRGMLACWAGMMVGCGLGYLLGARAGEAALRRMAGEAEVRRLAGLSGRHGHWFLLVLRGVPVLAESSVVFAGVSRMPLRRFFGTTALANLGICATYAAVGASAVRFGSFLVLFAGIVLLPGLALWAVRRGTKHS
ncbi:membrane protein DedA, SNARE-associated domain [Stigmatella aurantiaca]|uniref:TVP38/TMEM64 family membrane protein n=1 Tax=Stigmatella aurantiaca TaxID=41 RepID=A0A1H7JV23_STIAU|nr:VTT domain-containing protein [Stigmatella aurantiaca]SEK78571.1 membrane protein DedA, SNARE-associated domain [Stigmatella aurantiaca]